MEKEDIKKAIRLCKNDFCRKLIYDYQGDNDYCCQDCIEEVIHYRSVTKTVEIVKAKPQPISEQEDSETLVMEYYPHKIYPTTVLYL